MGRHLLEPMSYFTNVRCLLTRAVMKERGIFAFIDTLQYNDFSHTYLLRYKLVSPTRFYRCKKEYGQGYIIPDHSAVHSDEGALGVFVVMRHMKIRSLATVLMLVHQASFYAQQNFTHDLKGSLCRYTCKALRGVKT